jgi:uncharacterized RDD family membrane protein YckC
MNEITINTTQNVNINFTAASVGERIGAYVIDYVVRISYVIAVFYLLFGVFDAERFFDDSDRWAFFAIISLLMLPYALYSLVLEATFEGQTLGKKILKTKVVKIDGYQASFGEYLMRWIFTIIDDSIVGIIVMATSKKTQRIGDMAAGTAVITLKNNVTIKNTILEELDEQYVPIYPMVIKLSDNDARIIKETFINALAIDDFELIGKLKDKIEMVTGIKNQSGNNRDFIRTVLKDYNYYTQNM